MGKVLGSFRNGWPGAVSRSIDDIIVAMNNGAGVDVPYGAPLFLISGQNACEDFDASTSTAEKFVGIAVRDADKTPETYGSNEGVYKPNELMDVLVRGSVVLEFDGAAVPGNSVYIRKADGKFVTSAGETNTTIQLPGVTVRTYRDAGGCAEVVLTKRNLM